MRPALVAVCYMSLNPLEILNPFIILHYRNRGNRLKPVAGLSWFSSRILILGYAPAKLAHDILTNNNNCHYYVKLRPLVCWSSDTVPCSHRFIAFINMFDFVDYSF